MYIQPYTYLKLQELIDLENSLDFFSRPDWNTKINVNTFTSSELKDHIFIIDERNNYIILFYGLLTDPLNKFSIGHQIYHSWLLGKTINTDSSVALNHTHLTIPLVETLFTGSIKDLESLRSDDSISPNLTWRILHYPYEKIKVEAFTDLKIIIEYFLKNFSAFQIRLAYGVVSERHQRSDKNSIIETISKHLVKHNFDTNTQYELKDFDRNSEPLILWKSRDKFSNVEFNILLGINFGYDNGFSAFKLGLGIYFPEEDLEFAPISERLFDNLDSSTKGIAFKRWIHHVNYGDILELINTFINSNYTKFFEAINYLLTQSRKKTFRSKDSSFFVLRTTHSREFHPYENSLENYHSKLGSNYGYNHYTHFLSWLSLAKEVKTNSSLMSLAQFIASFVIKN